MYPASHELAVQEAAAALPPQQFAEFRKLARELAAHQSRWGLLLLQYEHAEDRDSVAAAVDKLFPQAAHVHIDGRQHPDWPALESAITAAAADASLVQLFGLDEWLDDSAAPARAEARLRAWNIRREAFAREVKSAVLCWLRPANITRFAQTAPDLWSWRTGMHDFSRRDHEVTFEYEGLQSKLTPFEENIDNRTVAQRTRRVSEIRQFLARSSNTATPEVRGALIDELAKLLRHLGNVDEALRMLREDLLPLAIKSGNERMVAITKGRIADILQERGQYAEAMDIRKHEELSTYLKLHDHAAMAATMGDIGDIYVAQGKFKDALEIYKRQLRLYESLKDVRGIAHAKLGMAEALHKLGQVDDALLMCRNEVLPTFQMLKDVREAACVQLTIADLLHAQRNDEEALHLLMHEARPAFERLGDIRNVAATQSRVASILAARGQQREALTIFHDQALPIFKQLGETAAQAVIESAINRIQRSLAG